MHLHVHALTPASLRVLPVAPRSAHLRLQVGMVGAAVMTFSIGRALVVGDGGKELRELLSMPWGVVSLVDLYTGFTILHTSRWPSLP